MRNNTCEILIPEKVPTLFACLIALLIPSTTRRKRSGDKGHPCLSPLSEVNKEESETFIKTAKEAVVC